jgi:rSAM/selenodomain-associated transferase 1
MIVEGRQGKTQALVVVAKAPLEGSVKTRLCSHLSPAQAAALYECLLSDIVGKMKRFEQAESWLAFAPEGEDYFRRNYPDKKLLAQRGKDLGERLHHIFVDLFRMNYEEVVVADSDSPTVPLSYIEQAFGWLRGKSGDVVLGPSADGGYYLVGLGRPAEHIFRGIPWSTDAVLGLTLKRASEMGLKTALLPQAYDIDVAENLNRLRQEFMASEEVRDLAPKTFAYLTNLYRRESLGLDKTLGGGTEETHDEPRR